MSAAGGVPRYDCIVIGAGHNGLACAALLARAGRGVLVLEAAERIGGAAATREFFPGYRVSAGAHLLHSLSADLRRDLRLDSHGLAAAATHMPTTSLLQGLAPLRIDAQGAGAEAGAYADYEARMRRFAGALAPALERTPPRLGAGRLSDRIELLRLGLRLRRLGRRDLRELLRIGGMNAFDWLNENFDSEPLKGALAFDAVLGTNFGPRSPGTVLTLLYRLAGQRIAGDAGLWQPVGGMGAVCAALAGAASAAGAVVRTATPVERVWIEGDRAVGVVLADGARIGAGTVISSADPKTTLLRLVGARHLDTDFVRRTTHFRARGLAAKLHLALDGVPRFAGLDADGLGGRLLIAPSMRYIEHAYDHAKYGEFSREPVLEITVPSVNDGTLAPPGKHVLSAILQYAPYAAGGGWDLQRPRLLKSAIDSMARFAPGLESQIVAAELLTPPDLERELRITGGHWHHGDLAFDQFFFVRPVPGATQYRSPVAGLFLCGAGSHPGGGVMGIAGRNAAREVLQGRG